MNTHTFLQDVVAEAVKSQTWYQKNANTIVAVLGFIGSALTVVITLPLDMPEVVKVALPSVVAALTAFAIKLTPNGAQLSQAGKLARAADHVPALPTIGSHQMDQINVGLAELRNRVDTLLTGPVNTPTTAVSYVPEVAPWLEPAEGEHVGRHRLDE